MKEVSGHTLYTKRSICDESILCASHLLIDECMLRHIQCCTEVEAHRQLNDDSWSVPLEELEAFIALLFLEHMVPTDCHWTVCGPVSGDIRQWHGIAFMKL